MEVTVQCTFTWLMFGSQDSSVVTDGRKTKQYLDPVELTTFATGPFNQTIERFSENTPKIERSCKLRRHAGDGERQETALVTAKE